MRAYALDVQSPAEMLAKLSRFSDQQRLRMATIVYATVNLDTWVVDFARAGHPYPLLIRTDGSGTFLSNAGGPPLGTGAVETYDEQRITLAAGETLLLYTDGLIERRGRTLTEGESALVEAATAAPDEPELKCRSIIERLTEGIAVPDDVAVLAVRAVGLHEQMEVHVPAEAEQLAIVRHLIRRWVSAHGGTDDDCAAFAIAVTEACANAVEHAYGPGHANIRLGAALEDGEATVTVRDSGDWREPRGDNRGRGIPVMKEFMDDVAIDAGDDGTTVELRRRIGAE
jgi:anti-sigma regulatory factor (Ser/Thr protein kinase)